MLSVFICDDDPRYQKMMYDCIQDYINMEHLDIEVAICTSDPNKILQYIKGVRVNGIYFLDVELDAEHNGLELATAIRQHDPRGFVVFITAHPQYMPLTFEFKLEALAYIQKEADADVRKKIRSAIDSANQKHIARPDEGSYIFQSQNGIKVSCSFDDILFFEADSSGTNRVILHTKKRLYVFYGSLEKILADLPVGQFYRCHKSCIVNVGNLTKRCRDALSQGNDRMPMQDGSECYVSSRKKRGLINLLNSVS